MQDAIQVTRLLEFRYLWIDVWIDAICIGHSDIDDVYLDDWNAEALRIGSYYLHSKCLISESAASDGSQELFVEQTAQDIRTSRSHISLAQELGSAMADAWTELISRYSKMRFTFETDRLVVIQGLANRLVDLHGGEYFGGVFRSHLADGLLWKNSYDKAHNALPGVPTWSWSSRCLNIWFLPVSHSFIRFTKPNVFPENRSPINLDTPEKRALRYVVNFEYDAECLMPERFEMLEVLFLGPHVLHKQRGYVDPCEFEESSVVDPDTIVSIEGILLRKSG